MSDLVERIFEAFVSAPYPGDDNICKTEWDEGVSDYFRGTTARGHDPADLHWHLVALSFFTDEAFRYWLPAFMQAELEAPEVTDSIAHDMVRSFADSSWRYRQFELGELAVIALFFRECHRRYGGDDDECAFARADRRITAFLAKRSAGAE